MPTKVFLPLRSNVGWFSEQEAIDRLERLLKMHIALFDRVILEDGTYFFMSDGDGQGYEWKVPPKAIANYDRTKLSFYVPGGTFGFAVDGKPLMQGNLKFGCNADFMPVIHKAGLEQATYFEWMRHELASELQEKTNELAETDYRDKEIAETLPDDRYLGPHLLKGFYRDAVFARALKVPFAVDHHFAGFLAKKRARAPVKITESIPVIFLDRWLELKLPDFTNYSWEKIHEFHESPQGDDFRRMIERLSAKVAAAIPESPSVDELRDMVANAFDEELLRELRARRTNWASAATDVTLNFVPFGSMISTAKDLAALGRDNTSWVSLL